jgi:hypothetical protein
VPVRRWFADLAWLPGQGVCRDVLISGRDVVRDGVHVLLPDVPGELSRAIHAVLS